MGQSVGEEVKQGKKLKPFQLFSRWYSEFDDIGHQNLQVKLGLWSVRKINNDFGKVTFTRN